jgi:hypothetical protein
MVEVRRPRIPREAREGIMRAWLEILHERHPGVHWVAVEQESSVHLTVREEARAVEVTAERGELAAAA